MAWTPAWSIKNLSQGSLLGRRTYAMQVRTIWDSDAHAAQVAGEACYISGPFSMPRLATMMTTNPALIFAPYLKMIANPVSGDTAATKFPNKWYEHFKDGTKVKQQGGFVNWLMESGYNAASQQSATVTGITASSWGEWSVKQAVSQVSTNNAAAANAGKHPYRSLWFDTAGTFCADAAPGFWSSTNPGWDPQDLSAYGSLTNKLKWLTMVHWKGDLARNQVAAFPAINPERLFVVANGMRGGAGGGGTGLELPPHVDMAMCEGWLYKFGNATWATSGAYESQLQLFLDCQAMGVVAQPMDWGANAGTAAAAKKVGRFVAASNLICARGLSTFDYGTTKGTRPDLETATDPNLYAMDLGTPRAGHSPASVAGTMGSTGHRVAVGASNGQASATGLYAREYDGGITIANITAAAINFKADHTYTNIDGGSAVTAGNLISVPALSGVFYTTTGGTGSTAPVNVYLPSVLGTPREGQLMRVELGSYTGSPAPVLTEQWRHAGAASGAGTAITGETGATYSIPFGSGGTPSVYASDAYGATVANGWGTADVGGAWTIEQGGTADYAKATGTGQFSHSSANTGKYISLNTALADLDTVVTLAWPSVPAGGNMQGSLCLRFADTSNYLAMNTNLFASGGHAFTGPQKVVANVATSLGTTKDLGVYVAGTGVKMRLRLEGANLKGKAWLAAGTEPAPWDWDVTDSTISAAGKLVIRSFRGSGNTNTSPQAKADNLTASSLVGTVTGLAGEYLKVAETATNSAGSAVGTAAYTAVIAAGAMSDPIWTTLPTASGSPSEGATLTADPGTITGSPTPTVTYQWETSADASPGSTSNISGETATTLVPASGTAGAYVRCNVQASNAGATVHQWTGWIGPIIAASGVPTATTPPSVSGTTTAGDPLTLDPGVWTGTPAPAITQQWQKSTDGGLSYTNITGAQNLTYLIQSGDVGSYIRAAVTATNTSGIAVESTSPVGVVTLPSDFPNLQISVSVE